MITDLYAKPKSKKAELLEFIKEKYWRRTSEILIWGTQNYSNRADRNARQLAQEGKIKRMDRQEKIMRFGNIHEDIWVFIKD